MHIKNKELELNIIRSILHDYATTKFTYEELFKRYDYASSTFYLRLREFDIYDEYIKAKETAEERGLYKLKFNKEYSDLPQDTRETYKSIIEDYSKGKLSLKKICDTYGLKESDFFRAVSKYPEISKAYDESKGIRKREISRRQEELIEEGLMTAMPALLEKLEKRTLKKAVKTEGTAVVAGRVVKVSKTATTVEEVEPDMNAIKTILSLAGMMDENKHLNISIDILHTTNTSAVESTEVDDMRRIEELQQKLGNYVEFEED